MYAQEDSLEALNMDSANLLSEAAHKQAISLQISLTGMGNTSGQMAGLMIVVGSQTKCTVTAILSGLMEKATKGFTLKEFMKSR